MMNLRALFLAVLFFGNIALLYAQGVQGIPYPLFEDGATWSSSQNSTNDILLDQEGLLWLAAKSKIVQWNGQQARIYDANATDGFGVEGTNFRKLFECNDSTLLILRQQENVNLTLLNKNEKSSRPAVFDFENNKNEKGYIADVFQQNETIYSVMHYGNYINIYEMVDEVFEFRRKVSFDYFMGQKPLHATFAYGTFWVGIEGEGIWRCKENGTELVLSLKDLPVGDLTNLLFLQTDKKGNLWLGLRNEVNIYIWNEAAQEFSSYPIPSQNLVNQLKEDRKGNLLFLSGKYPRDIAEAQLLTDTTWINYSALIPKNMVNVYPSEDWTKSFFAATTANVNIVEIQKTQIQSFLNFNPDNKEWGFLTKGINEDEAGNIYFLSEINGFYRLDKTTEDTTRIPVVDESGNEIDYRCGGALHRDKNGNLWFKTCTGKTQGRLMKFNPQTEQFNIYYFDNLIRDIDIGSDNQIWISFHNLQDRRGQLSVFDIEKEKFLPIELSDEAGNTFFPEPRFCLFQNDSIVWIGTINGLVKINPKTRSFKTFTTENSQLKNDQIIAMHQNYEGDLILGTYGGGVQIFNPITENNNTFTSEENGLVQDYVCGILPIDSTRYWLSTFDGLSYWDTKLNLFVNTNKKQGLSHFEFNRYAFHKSSDGKFYFGNVNGVNRINADQIVGVNRPPILGLSSISKYYGNEDSLYIQNTHLKQIKTIELTPDVTYLQFDFYLNDFIGQEKSKVMTKLENTDDEWVSANEKKQVRYRLLPQGNYTMLVKGFSSNGVSSVNTLEFKIISKPYFYNTWWFYLIVLGALTAIGSWLFRWRIQQIKKEENEKQNIQKRFAALELQALQAQLNPHFIFNALGAIQYYIQVNDVESADIYLTRFAQLMRKYLDGSKEKMITLKKEIELLQIYSELEQLRFDKIFDIEFIVDPTLEIEDISLPSMMIQPFVENSVNHGLSPRKDGKGKLEIHFYQKNNSLICEIRDNGIGRKNAQVNKRKGHKSRGMKILDEKIQTMKMSGIMDIKIKISDWKKEDDEYPGTLVTLDFSNLLE